MKGILFVALLAAAGVYFIMHQMNFAIGQTKRGASARPLFEAPKVRDGDVAAMKDFLGKFLDREIQQVEQHADEKTRQDMRRHLKKLEDLEKL